MMERRAHKRVSESKAFMIEPNTMSKSILVVEDHVDSASSLARILSRQGHRVSIAASIREANALAAGHRFDVALCDLGLPDGDGCDLMRELAARYGLKGIALTGFGMPADLERVTAAGFSAHVLKPISFDHLLTVLQEVTESNPEPAEPAGDAGLSAAAP